MSPEQLMVKEFHDKFNCLISDKPHIPDALTLLLRIRLILEETSEIAKACSNKDMIEIADGLCDLLYVVYGFGVVLGIDLEPIFKEVQKSNMSKIPDHDTGGKVLKGDNWIPPDIESKLKEQGWMNEI